MKIKIVAALMDAKEIHFMIMKL